MPLPEILAPAGTPVFKEAGHSHRRISIHRDVPMGTGHARKRQKYTTAYRIVTVEWFLRPNMELTVDAWFENDLAAGSREFAAAVARLGSRGLMWWTARWVSPMRWTPLQNGYWRVSGSLRLTGEGSLTPPETTSAAVEFGMALTGSAAATTNNNAEVEFGMDLTQFTTGAVEFGMDLTQLAPSETVYRITRGGDRRVTRGGDDRTVR